MSDPSRPHGCNSSAFGLKHQATCATVGPATRAFRRGSSCLTNDVGGVRSATHEVADVHVQRTAPWMPQCPHGKDRYYCRGCAGGAFCEHNKRRRQCRECHGSSVCEHDKQRTQCRECHGSSFCEHGKWRTRCRECQGGSICEHDKQRTRCRECHGWSICEHGKERTRCRECHGTSICPHDRLRPFCKDCNNFVCNLGECQQVRFRAASKLQGHMQSFHSDDPKALTKKSCASSKL